MPRSGIRCLKGARVAARSAGSGWNFKILRVIFVQIRHPRHSRTVQIIEIIIIIIIVIMIIIIIIIFFSFLRSTPPPIRQFET